MTDTDLISTPAPEAAPSAEAPARGGRSRGTGLNAMVLTELRQLAGELGIRGTSGMRKGDLVAAIAARDGEAAEAPGEHERAREEGEESGQAVRVVLGQRGVERRDP